MIDNLNDLENLQDNEEQVIQNDSDDDEVCSDESEGGWIPWFCRLEGNEFLIEIDDTFIKNTMNLYGLLKGHKNYKKYIEVILSPESPSSIEIQSEEYLETIKNCREIYGLLHARYIATPEGLALIRERYLNGIYGYCPRILCDKQLLLPIGLSEDIKYSRVRVYCPKCEDIYKPRQKCPEIDGAFFGISFPQLFLMTYPDLSPKINKYKFIVPKLYGFKIYGKRGSKYYKEILSNK